MSLCDTCADPGHCCRNIPIFSHGMLTPLQILAYVVEQEWPFQIESVDDRGIGRYSCRNLTPEGRCGDYDNRPYICSDFEPGQDLLCIHHKPTAPCCQGHGAYHALKIELESKS